MCDSYPEPPPHTHALSPPQSHNVETKIGREMEWKNSDVTGGKNALKQQRERMDEPSHHVSEELTGEKPLSFK